MANPSDSPAAGTPARSPLGWIPLPLRMLVYSVVFLGFVLAALPWAFYQLDVYVPVVHVEIGFPLRVVGVVFGGIAFVLYLAASYILTSRGKGAYVEFDPPTELVIVGPYQYCRNPVVVTLLATMLGEAIALSSTGVLLMFGIIAFLANGQVREIEEPLLRKRYGAAYDDYCARVPRWIPRLRRR
jgi:protein-S-isoprenylcysteine O-methyltransferase Ste14